MARIRSSSKNGTMFRLVGILLALLTCPVAAGARRSALSTVPTIHSRGGATTKTTRIPSATVAGLKSSLASALAAGCSKTLLAPFDTLKTIQQHYRSSGTALNLLEASQIVLKRPNGIREFYAGLGVTVIGSMPSVGLYFGVYSYCKKKLQPILEKHLPDNVPNSFIFGMSIMTSAAIGNTVASFSRVPYEVVKQKLQTGLYATTWQALSSMAKEAGVRAFFPLGGVSIQMMRDIPYAMVTLLSYEVLKKSMARYKKTYPEGIVDAATGAMAGGLGSYVTNPMDVIKTRIQTSPELYDGSILLCFQSTFQEGGLRAFLRGSVPRLLHKIPANGFFFLFYEFFQTLLGVQ